MYWIFWVNAYWYDVLEQSGIIWEQGTAMH